MPTSTNTGTTSPTLPSVTAKLNRIITYPNASADPVAVAYYETTLTVNGITFASPEVSVSWRLMDVEKTVTVDVGETPLTLPYAVVSMLVTAIADKEKELLDNPPVIEESVTETPATEADPVA